MGISNHYDTMQIIVSVINALSLTGLTSGAVFQEVVQYQDARPPQGPIPVALPFVSVSPYGPEKIGEELNDRDGVYYGILIGIIARAGDVTLEQRLSWRQSIRRHLNNVSVSDLITQFSLTPNTNMGMNYKLTVEPGPCVEPQAWKDRNASVSGMVIRAWFQEPRQ